MTSVLVYYKTQSLNKHWRTRKKKELNIKNEHFKNVYLVQEDSNKIHCFLEYISTSFIGMCNKKLFSKSGNFRKVGKVTLDPTCSNVGSLLSTCWFCWHTIESAACSVRASLINNNSLQSWCDGKIAAVSNNKEKRQVGLFYYLWRETLKGSQWGLINWCRLNS